MKPLIVAALLSPALALAQSVDIKGIPFGATEAQIKQAFKSVVCTASGNTAVGDRNCMARDTYGGAKASIMFSLYNDAMQSAYITIRPEDYGDVILAMTQRFGRPVRSDVRVVTTRTGEKYNNVVREWFVDGIGITAEKYGGLVTEGRILFQSAAADEQFRARQRDQIPERAKDL